MNRKRRRPRHWIFSEKVKSYKVENLVRVTVSEEKELQETARMLDEFNGVEFVGMEFDHSRKNELKGKAVAQALETISDQLSVIRGFGRRWQLVLIL